MTFSNLTTIDQLREFLDGTRSCAHQVPGNAGERYQLIQKTLIQFRYRSLGKADKGVVIRFAMNVSGYSRQQLTRLIRHYVRHGKLVRAQKTSGGFSRRYTVADIRLLAEMDELHLAPSGGVIKKLCERAWHHFQDARYERLAGISVSHIYNLRRSDTYRQKRRHFEKTRPVAVNIGERRKPQPEGLPGFLRVDTVHQGDQDKTKGVYHINAVDEVSQFQVSVCVEKISELFLIPALITMMEKLPFKIRGFHSDNGSEYINKRVAELLGKLHVEFTKSRSRQSNDNALVEGKNAAIIRKQFGYQHIPARWAAQINEHLQEPLYRYVNFHRPCYFPTTITDDKGKQKKKYTYQNMMTPYEKLLTLAHVEQHLRPGVTLESLANTAREMSDNDAAKRLQDARQLVFSKVFARDTRRA